MLKQETKLNKQKTGSFQLSHCQASYAAFSNKEIPCLVTFHPSPRSGPHLYSLPSEQRGLAGIREGKPKAL